MPVERTFIGQSDPPLTSRGAAQIRCWIPTLAARGITAIFASDLGRTMESARILAQGLGVDVTPMPAFREIDLGEWEGRPMSEIRGAFPLAWEERGRDLARFRPPAGECFEDVRARAVPAFLEIAGKYRDGSGTPLIVTHAGVIRVLLCHVLGMPLNNIFRIAVSLASLHCMDIGANPFTLQSVNHCHGALVAHGETAAREAF